MNQNGSLDIVFDPGANSIVTAFAGQTDGKIVAGGLFTTLAGQPRDHIGRLSIETAALQELTVAGDGASVSWMRGGAGPEVGRVTFELSSDGVTYSLLGAGTRIAGGWELNGLALPFRQNLFIRARSYYATGEIAGTGSVVESVRNEYLNGTAPVITSEDHITFITGAASSFTVTAAGAPAAALKCGEDIPLRQDARRSSASAKCALEIARPPSPGRCPSAARERLATPDR